MNTNEEHQKPNEQSAHSLELIVNGQKFKWHGQWITGKEIKELSGAPDDLPLFLIVTAPWEDELIQDHARVDLAREGVERFVSKEHHAHHVILTIETTEGNWQNASFLKSLTVAQLIKKVIDKFHFAANGKYALRLKGSGSDFAPNLTLEQCHLKNHDILQFTDLGNGA